MGLGSFLKSAAKKVQLYGQAARRQKFYGDNVDTELIPAMRAQLIYSLQKDEEERAAKREEREAREEERRWRREQADQIRDDRKAAALEQSRQRYARLASNALVPIQGGKKYLVNTNALPATDLPDDEREALNLGLIRDAERSSYEKEAAREATLAEKAAALQQQIAMAKLAAELARQTHRTNRDYDIDNPPPARPDKVTDEELWNQSRQTAMGELVDGQPFNPARQVEIFQALKANRDKLFAPPPEPVGAFGGGPPLREPSLEERIGRIDLSTLGASAGPGPGVGAKPPELVKYKGQMVPFDQLPPDAKARVMANLGR